LSLLQSFSNWRIQRLLKRISANPALLSEFFKSNPLGSLLVQDKWSEEGTQHPQDDLAAHGAVFLVNVFAYASIRAIAQDIAATPLLLQRKKRIEGQTEWVTQDGTDKSSKEIFDLFSRPNLQESWPHLSERLSMAIDSTGNGYLVFTEDEGGELYFINPAWVKVVVTTDGRLSGYQISNSGARQRYELENIIHFKLANPTGEWYGRPPSKSIEKSIMTKISMNDHFRAFFRNAGVLGTILSTDRALQPDQIEKMKKQFNAEHGGVHNAFRVAILQLGVKAEKIAHSVKDLMPKELNDMVREEILAAYKVPPVKIGILDGATYANADQQEQIYQQGTVEPRRVLIENTLTNNFIIPRFSDEWRVIYDRSGIDALQEDRTAVSVRVVSQWNAGLIKRNEARLKLGYDPLEEDDGKGEEFQEQISFDLQGEGEANSDGGGEGIRPLLLRKDVSSPRSLIWKSLDSRNRQRERILFGKIKNYLAEQRDRVVERVEKITGKGLMMNRLLLYLKEDIPDNLLERLFVIDAENEILAKELGSVLESLAEQAGQDSLNAFNIDLEFNVRDPRVQNVIGTFQNRIKRINTTTWEQLRKTIGDSIDNGDSIATLADKITEKYDFILANKGRARTIARTETNGISNASSMEGYRQAGVEKKEWLSVQDGNVRDGHVDADGQIVNLNEHFLVDGELLMYPGDVNGSAANVINCRCIPAAVIGD